MTTHFKSISDEERLLLLEQGRQAREAKIAWAKENLRDDYKDKPLWRELAFKHGVRLPRSYIPATETKYLKRLFRTKGLDISKWLEESTGCKTIKQLNDLNPDAPAYAVVGWALEWIENEVNTGLRD